MGILACDFADLTAGLEPKKTDKKGVTRCYVNMPESNQAYTYPVNQSSPTHP
ncbi:Uncharacterised protein [Vibrio cholerae]|uniref:Uncharacterized protein n=1 Tax=Vibrio cholerae TaxID=666 RepID=A0A656A8F1_VIBCL|nr:Uncharacterised protein [Vibrio cholerae]CSD01090.1 Uncharacterised protein [Vibrio cholerae]